jgi:hypothetical protein
MRRKVVLVMYAGSTIPLNAANALAMEAVFFFILDGCTWISCADFQPLYTVLGRNS